MQNIVIYERERLIREFRHELGGIEAEVAQDGPEEPSATLPQMIRFAETNLRCLSAVASNAMSNPETVLAQCQFFRGSILRMYYGGFAEHAVPLLKSYERTLKKSPHFI